MKRVGIPRALLYFRDGNLWRIFFENMGFEVVISPPSDAGIVAAGLPRVSAEVCLPIKLLAGHVARLEGSVDYLFLPRLVSNRQGLYACPKMIGIVDVLRLQLGPRVRLLSPAIRRGQTGPLLALGISLCRNPLRALAAYRIARSRTAPKPARLEFPPDRLKIALLSHFYISGDDYISRDIFAVFKKANALLYFKEDLSRKILARGRKGASVPVSEVAADSVQWIFERELARAFEFFRDRVDGVCQIVSFGCGPDSLVSELMVRSAKKRDLPFLQLVIDEHSAKAGIVTRVEAFLEMVTRAKARKQGTVQQSSDKAVGQSSTAATIQGSG